MENKKRMGVQTVALGSDVTIAGYASIVGEKEGEGPLGCFFDKIESDPMLGEATWEKAERMLFSKTMNLAFEKSSISPGEINYVFAGDLLNQCVSSSYAVKEMGIPFFRHIRGVLYNGGKHKPCGDDGGWRFCHPFYGGGR